MKAIAVNVEHITGYGKVVTKVIKMLVVIVLSNNQQEVASAPSCEASCSRVDTRGGSFEGIVEVV